jgi:tetratricopeptide (TPR) repeat protein
MRPPAARALLAGAVLLALPGGARLAGAEATGPTAAAIALYQQQRYPEAKAALERIVAADGSNAAACYYLALTLRKVDPSSLDSARQWLRKAVRLAPANETYLAEYGGVTMLVAQRDHSLSDAVDGSDAMTKAIKMNPADLDATWGLMLFRAQAPWPFGSPHQAFALAAEIEKRDPKRGPGAYHAMAASFEKAGRGRQAKEANEIAQKLAQTPAK